MTDEEKATLNAAMAAFDQIICEDHDDPTQFWVCRLGPQLLKIDDIVEFAAGYGIVVSP